MRDGRSNAKLQSMVGGNWDWSEIEKTLKVNWVETVRDIRFLLSEDMLKELKLPEKLLDFFTTQCMKTFTSDEKAKTKIFRFQHDMDKNGILYWLGSEGKQNTWHNPAERGLVKVTASTKMSDSAPLSSIVGRSIVRTVTKPQEKSWLAVDFLQRKIRPTHYTLRHYASWDTEALRNWRLEGSDDGYNWKCIREHRHDTSLNGKGSLHTWPIENCENFFTAFRILMTGPNSNRHYYLACSGFEIYGELQDTVGFSQENMAAPSETREFIYNFDFDLNGMVYWLGTKMGTAAWKNPMEMGAVEVTMSSVGSDSEPPPVLVGRSSVRCVTGPKRNSFFMVDFKGHGVRPTRYTLRHYSSFDSEGLRTWKLEGANNSTNGTDGTWQPLSLHRDDRALNRKGGSYTWVIPQENVQRKSFSQFKVTQTDVNSNNHHYLACSGFEIYGSYTGKAEVEQAPVGDAAQPRGPIKRFKYQSDFDQTGILYFMGTQGLSRQWVNPGTSGDCRVTASSIMADSQPITAIVGRVAVRCVTKPHQNSWMAINLCGNQVRATHYTLRHYSSWDTEALRYWNFEGSVNGRTWYPIRKHFDDKALNRQGGTNTWNVSCDTFYSHFRVYMTGRNSNNHWYLSLSGIELYGELRGPILSRGVASPRSGAVAAAANGRPAAGADDKGPSDFTYHHDLDEHGLMYYLGTRGKRQSWHNPAQLGEVILRCSGLMSDSAPLHTVVGREPVRCCTKPIRNAWIMIQLMNYCIRPTAYTLRHYNSWDTEALRNWRFEGSLDGTHWTTIREHHQDSSLRFKSQTHTWKLNVRDYYSYFRILQFGKNSNSHLYMSISGFEVYGTVLRQNTNFSWDNRALHRSKYVIVDEGSNSIVNSGTTDAWQTCKSLQPFDAAKMGRVMEVNFLLEHSEHTTNSWKFIVGCAPTAFQCTGNKQWLGSQRSWGYIGGTGGKCFNIGKSDPYGVKWGRSGDLITLRADSQTGTMEFAINDTEQGVAFRNFNIAGSFHPAFSLTGKGSRVRLLERVRPSDPVQVAPASFGANLGGGGRGWDPGCKTASLEISADGWTVSNKGANDTWQMLAAKQSYSSGSVDFEFEVIRDTNTTNTWRFIVGCVPKTFNPHDTAWLGSQNSWGYVGGTGGKCHNVGKSEPYGRKFTTGDRVTCSLDFGRKTISFSKNGRTQGIAFTDLQGAVRPAVSFCGTGATVRLHLSR